MARRTWWWHLIDAAIVAAIIALFGWLAGAWG